MEYNVQLYIQRKESIPRLPYHRHRESRAVGKKRFCSITNALLRPSRQIRHLHQRWRSYEKKVGSTSDFVTVEVREGWLERALEEAKALKSKLKNSLLSGDGVVAGVLGELATCHALGGAGRHQNTYDWDIALRGSTVDVKTKVRDRMPKTHYAASIPAITRRQLCNYYIFTSAKRDLSEVYVLGYIPTDTFFKEAAVLEKGESDGNTSFVARCKTYNLEYSKLYCIGEMR